MDLLKVVREALGFAEPRPDDHVREDELSVVPVIELQLSDGFRPVVIERWLRAYGDSLRRIVETETDWWRTEVECLSSRRDDGGRDAGGPSRPRVPDRPPSWSRPSWPSTTGSRSTRGQERRGGRGGRAGAGRPVPSGAPSAGDVLPRHHRVHAADRGAGRRGRGRAGGEAGRPGPAVLPGARRAAGEVARRRRDVLLPGPGRWRAGRRSTWSRGRRARPSARTGSGSTPGRWSSRRATTSAGPSTSRRRISEYARPGEVLVSQEVVDAADLEAVGFTRSGRSS